MRFFLYLFLILSFISQRVFAAGENCSSPIAVSVGCPAVTLTNQSSLGMGNDVTNWKYSLSYTYILTGEDLVYELTLPSGITQLMISLNNVNKAANVYTSTTCAINSTTLYTPTYISSGSNNNLSITPPATGNVLYLYVDHSGSSALTFDISFGAVTKGIALNIPDTRGKLEFVKTNCVNPSFLPQLDLYKDGSKLANPSSFGPNSQSHEFCFKLLIQNLTGKEAVKSFSFTFATAGFSGISVASSSMPGKYSSGTWNATVTGNVVLWTYINTIDPYKGDTDDLTTNCQEFTFCMNATPINTAAQQIINIWVTGDGLTPGYTGYQYSGCCASNNCNLYGATGYKGLSGTAFGNPTSGAAGFGIGIGSSGLPVEVLDIWTENFTTLHWKTMHEVKLSHYVVQYSSEGKDYIDVQEILAAGNDMGGVYDYVTDLSKYIHDNGYLRIKSVDDDGSEGFSKIIPYTLSSSIALDVLLSPNPVKDLLYIQSSEELQRVVLYNLHGTILLNRILSSEEHLTELFFDFEKEPRGIYTLQLITSRGIIQKQVIKD